MRETFWEPLPFAVVRRRGVEAWIDDDGALRGIAIVSRGVRARSTRLALEVSHLGATEVEPPQDLGIDLHDQRPAPLAR